MEQSQMSKFCIELKGMMLPDAIAAVVIAWHDAQDTEPINIDDEWHERVRSEIRRQHGRGWVLRSVGKSRFRPQGMAQLIHRKSDNTKSTTVLPYEYSHENENKILKCALHLCEQVAMCEGNVSLQEAAKVVLPFYADERTTHPAGDPPCHQQRRLPSVPQ
jgi:hypothetical protein